MAVLDSTAVREREVPPRERIAGNGTRISPHDWLDGYEGAKPVRVGNAAYGQRQLDVFGELAAVIYEAGRHFHKHRPEAVNALMGIACYVATSWQQPDRGIWELRGPERSFTASKVAAWAALDRAIRYAEEHGLEEPVDNLRVARNANFDEVCREGFNTELNTFTQYTGVRAGREPPLHTVERLLAGYPPARCRHHQGNGARASPGGIAASVQTGGRSRGALGRGRRISRLLVLARHGL